jgi:hypothetical protein
VQNTGLTGAFDVTIRDRLPDGPTGGMCDFAPEVQSVTLAGAPLTQGTHYTLGYAGAPTCELTLTLLDAAGAIGPGQHLVINYRTRLDADSQDGITLTNVAGATEWFNADSTVLNRVTFPRTLTNGTPGTIDHEDAHTVTVALHGYFFEKTVADLTSGVNPASTAAPGDRLRYTLRLQATDVPLTDVRFTDDLGAMNASAVFVPGSLQLVAGTIPPGADASNTNPNGGTNNAGVIDIRNLNLAANTAVSISFDITLAGGLADGTIVLNQADLISAGIKVADSDDPNVNGQADPNVSGDEDPTRVLIQAVPPPALQKANTQATAAVGVPFAYRITVPPTPHTRAALRRAHPRRPQRVRGGPPVRERREDLRSGVVDARQHRQRDPARDRGSGERDRHPGRPAGRPRDHGRAHEHGRERRGPPVHEHRELHLRPRRRESGQPAAGRARHDRADDDRRARPHAPEVRPGPDGARHARGVHARRPQPDHDPAWNLTITDHLPDTAQGGTCDSAPTAVTARVFQADGVTPVSPALVAGTDFTVSWLGVPSCTLSLTMQTATAVVGPDQRLIVTYQTVLDAGSQDGASLTNIAGAVQWFSAAASSRSAARSRARSPTARSARSTSRTRTP